MSGHTKRCGTCVLFVPHIPKSGWEDGECSAQPEGHPLRIPVQVSTGTECRYWRAAVARAEGNGEGTCGCDGQKGQGCTICAAPTRPEDPTR